MVNCLKEVKGELQDLSYKKYFSIVQHFKVKLVIVDNLRKT